MTGRPPQSSIDGGNTEPRSKVTNQCSPEALIVNALVLFAVLEADLGRARKVSRLRLLRPLLMSASIVPMFLEAIATHGTGLALEIGGGVAGALLGVTAAGLDAERAPRFLDRSRRDPRGCRLCRRSGSP